MLNGHDQSLIGREKAIPGLGVLLQPSEMRRLLCRQATVSDPGELRAGYLRYKPGRNCIARFEFEAGGERRYAYAKAFGADAGEKLKKVREKANGSSPLGPGTVVLEDKKIQFSVFPHDSKLRSVARLADSEARSDLLSRLFKSRRGWDAGRFHTLNYKPERRIVARFTTPDGECATIKFYANGEFDRIREYRKHLQPVPHVRFPEWIGGSKAHRALAFSWIPGTILRDLPADRRVEATRQAGLSLAHFHRSRQPRFKPLDDGLVATRTLALAKNLAPLMPAEAGHAMELARALVHWREGLAGPTTPVHGDFYDKQVVVGDGGLTLIDNDKAHLGHPAADLGCYIAHLERNAVNRAISLEEVAALSAALLEGYAEANPGLDLSQLGVHRAFSLFSLVHNPFRDRAPDWPEQTRALLHRATALFETG